MIRATWNGAVLAESDDTQYLRDSTTHTRCPWKGTASYYSLVADGTENLDAAWYYPEPSPAPHKIAGRVAFWRGVTVEPVGSAGGVAAAGDRSRQPLLARLRRR